MTKTVCDICGKDMPSEIYSKPIKDYKFSISTYGKVWDICTECRDKLDKWIKKQKAESEIHCNYTDAEISKSFIEDVEAVKDLLPRKESEG